MRILRRLNIPPSIIVEKYSGYIFPLAIFSLAFYLQYSVAFLGLDLHHDLLMFDAARNFYSGQVPYRDFFYQYNLATVFLHGATLATLGLNIVALKKITVLFYALIALLIYLSCAIEGCKRSGFLLSIIWTMLSPFYMLAMHGYHPWSTVYMMFACMAGLFFLQLSIRKNQLVFSFIAGVFFSLGFWFKQVAAFQIIGVAIWLALNIWLSLSDKIDYLKYIKIISGYALGGLVASIPFFVYLYTESAILTWWNDTVIFNKYFALDSQNTTGIVKSLEIAFPISRDMGYRSIFWALCPLILFVVSFQIFIYKGRSFGLTKLQKENIALFALAGFAGWVEYFPIPHPFHTQMFTAPIFVVIGLLLGKHPASFTEGRKYYLIFLAIYAFILIGGYEAIRSMQGRNVKTAAYSNGKATEIYLNSSFDGLKIDNHVAENLSKFYRKLEELKSSSNSGEFIPLSVDPIRGLLPGRVDQLSGFKMGVNWTWPNELVEPGFSNKINNDMQQRNQPIYADSLIYIPGYLPAALLEMWSPITAAHTLYSPEPISSKLINSDNSKSSILFVGSHDFDWKSRSILFPFTNSNHAINLLPMNELSKDDLENIKNIHMNFVDEKDLPKILSSHQLAYLKIYDKYYGDRLSALYERDVNGRGIISKDLNCENKKNMAYFMLTQGKLFESQNRPAYASTYAFLESDRPFLSVATKNDSKLHYFWKKNGPKIVAKYFIEERKSPDIYLGFKSILTKGADLYGVAQIELQYGGSKSYFYSFCDPQNSK